MIYNGGGRHLMPSRVRKMARFVRAVPHNPAGTWSVMGVYLGLSEAILLGGDWSRRKCARMFKSAEGRGLIARMPSRVPSMSPDSRIPGNGSDTRLVRKELAWRRTELGDRFLKEFEEMFPEEVQCL